MLELQRSIETLETEFNGENITLSDICFAPLAPDNKNCTIQSVFNYFKNDNDTFNKIETASSGWVTYDYLDHILFCSV